jgi:hypothetical protein
MDVLLVEPKYYTKYPPLGLLKLSSYHKAHGDNVFLVRGLEENLNLSPEIIEITSLFTYSWKPVHQAISYYHKIYPEAKIHVGGIYASIMPERIESTFPYVTVYRGLHEEADKFIPDYNILKETEKWNDWKKSILFSTRGCIRKCPFCVVPIIEGKIRVVVDEISELVHPDHNEIVLWDNNFLASPQWKKSINQLIDIGMKVDFNQGLDARLMDEEKASLISELKLSTTIRLAYDFKEEAYAAEKAVEYLNDAGIRKKNIMFYTLYNFYDSSKNKGDDPESFFEIIRHITQMGCVSYPMRYEPIDSLKKNSYISKLWTPDELENVADARRVLGFGGAFPPYKGLVNKFHMAEGFKNAFELNPIKKN